MLRARFAPFAWGVVIVSFLVIVWGAYVRASGSGAGCGSHWPLCNGTVLPRNPALETIVEFLHRATSGVALLLVIGLAVLARRTYPAGHVVRRAAWASLFFMVTEALVGAGLVLLELVAHNDSIARAVYLGVHLVNTFLLLAALTLTAWWGSGRPAPVRPVDWRRLAPLLLILGGLLLVGVTGAVTALGDTLFPAGSLAEGMRQDTSPTAHILLRLRVLHPILAITVGTVLLVLSVRGTLRETSPATSLVGRFAAGLVLTQVAAGVLNLLLLAPIWMQLVHLFLADLVWLSAVLLTACAAAETVQTASRSQSPALDTAIAHR
ncbi:MAG: Protoheme farnesyltransferase [Gemmatimonadetes bacterium]|nr:Protoheme farnesyltransferase [Gemmatimonadota bacterium]